MITVTVSTKEKVFSPEKEVFYSISILNKAPYTKAKDIVLIGFIPSAFEVSILGEEKLIPITLSRASGGTRIQINLSQAAKQTIGLRLGMSITLKTDKKVDSFTNRLALKEDGKLSFMAQAEPIHFISKEA